MRRAKPLSPDAMRHQIAKLVREGKMPSLEQLCAAITETKAKFAPRIRRAQREYRAKISIN